MRASVYIYYFIVILLLLLVILAMDFKLYAKFEDIPIKKYNLYMMS